MDKKTTQRIDVRGLIRPQEISYRVGDATAPEALGPKIIAHICNDSGGWGAGFVLAVSGRWPEPEQAYRSWYAERERNDFRLGAMQLVTVESRLWVANIIGQHGTTAGPDGPPIRYGAVEMGLRALADRALQLDASVHMPRIGCGLAGGRWDEIQPIVAGALCERGVEVYVYDLR